MKFLINLLEDLEVLSKYEVEVCDASNKVLGKVKVIAGNEKEAKKLALQKKRGVAAKVVSKEDVE